MRPTAAGPPAPLAGPGRPSAARHTRDSLAADFAALGVAAGGTVLVHAAMKPVGPVRAPDGPPGAGPGADPAAEVVLAALRQALGPAGTVVVPAFTESNSATSRLHRRRTRGMTPEQLAGYRAAMPPFDRRTTPSENVGRLAEAVRLHPGAHRSGHPQTSFAALGPGAAGLTAAHDTRDHLGENSPLRKLYDDGASVVLIGVGFAVCSAFHLAEYRIPNVPFREYGCVVRRGGTAQWITYRDAALDDGDFGALGGAFERSRPSHATPAASSPVRLGLIGNAESRCFPVRDAVDFAVDWLSENRPRDRV